MIKVEAKEFISAIDAAAVGEGKGYVLLIDPQKTDIGNGKMAQIASISSSDGTKTGLTNFQIIAEGEKGCTISVSANLRYAVMSLAKVTKVIHIHLQETYLSLTDEKEESEIRVEYLAKQDIVMKLPDKPEGSVLFVMNREKFISAIQMGGYSASDKQPMPEYTCIYFYVDVEAKELWIASKRNEMACRAVVQLDKVQNYMDSHKQWHLLNHHFIQRMMDQLTGEQIQVGFNDKFMVVQCATGLFGCKKNEGDFQQIFSDLLSDKEYDYYGKVLKKELLTGMEIALVGSEKLCLLFETLENGNMKITRRDGINKATVMQREHSGRMPCTCLACDLLRMILGGSKEETLYYFGKIPEGKERGYFRVSGMNEGIRYNAVLAPINQKKMEEELRKKKKK